MKRVQIALIFSLILVYVQGLFVPLMNHNAAHHANIALHMYLTGDYLNLIDRGGDYLDKPHLLFWLAALSYHLFGVTAFAYKFFSLVFALIGIYATWRIGKWVSGEGTGCYAALILASAFAFVLSLNDVRMDAMVVSCIAFSTWQLLELWYTESRRSLFLSGLGLALGFATKGAVAVALPVLVTVLLALQQRRISDLLAPRWVLLVLLTVILLLPLFYCFYVQFDLHPEKVIRGRSGNSGIGFLLLGQSVQRFTGSGWGSRAADPFYLFHTFLWAFLPWSILAIIALGSHIRSWFSQRETAINGKVFAIAITTVVVFLLISFSRFKNDHYINILFPYFAVLTAHFLQELHPRYHRALFRLQLVLSAGLMVLVGGVNAWAFPTKSPWIAISAGLLIAFWVYTTTTGDDRYRAIVLSFAASVISFFLLNFNFYPRLLTYQSGQVLAQKIKSAGINPDHLYYFNTPDRNYSLDFSLESLPASLTIDGLRNRKDTVYLFADRLKIDTLQQAGIPFQLVFEVPHYNVSTLRLRFLHPATRHQKLEPHYILKICGIPSP